MKTMNDKLLSREAGIFVLNALNKLIENDKYLLKTDVSERSISHRLAIYLQTEFPLFHVDCEYNRDGIHPKMISQMHLATSPEDTAAKTVYPDIIVHIRGSSKNYLVIELKKSNNSTDRQIDLHKLGCYKRELKYEFALFLELEIGGDPKLSDLRWVDA